VINQEALVLQLSLLESFIPFVGVVGETIDLILEYPP
jgi:hypothetical protein